MILLQLGGNLDLNGNDITGTGSISITGALDVSGPNDFVEVRADDSEEVIIENKCPRYQQILDQPNVIGSDIDFDIYYNCPITKLMLTEDGILQGISNSEIKTCPI